MASPSSILAWEIPEQRRLAGYTLWDHRRVSQDLATKQQQQSIQKQFFLRIDFQDKIITQTYKNICMQKTEIEINGTELKAQR